MYQNYPNPFNPSTKIKFDLPVSSAVKIVVFDVLGREVSTLVKGNMQPGSYEIDFNASDYPTGIYFYRIEANGFSSVKKMALIK